MHITSEINKVKSIEIEWSHFYQIIISSELVVILGLLNDYTNRKNLFKVNILANFIYYINLRNSINTFCYKPTDHQSITASKLCITEVVSIQVYFCCF